MESTSCSAPSTLNPQPSTFSISVIIPTLNEAARIAELIAATRQVGECSTACSAPSCLNPSPSSLSQIIVVDGGSTDGTREQAASADIVLVSEPGRARQQNAGAAASGGDVLLFLHADCRLPAGAFEAIRAALQRDERTVGGCFEQRIDADGRLYRWLEWGNALRVRWLGMAYGDQGIFIRRTMFEELGRFDDVKLMEDVLLMKRLRQRGRVVLLNERLIASARRWQRHGVIRQTLRNWLLLTLALCGVSPNKLAWLYPNTR